MVSVGQVALLALFRSPLPSAQALGEVGSLCPSSSCSCWECAPCVAASCPSPRAYHPLQRGPVCMAPALLGSSCSGATWHVHRWLGCTLRAGRRSRRSLRVMGCRVPVCHAGLLTGWRLLRGAVRPAVCPSQGVLGSWDAAAGRLRLG